MRHIGSMLAVSLAIGVGLASCGKPAEKEAAAPSTETTTTTAPEAAPAAPTGLTDAQKAAVVAELPAPYNAGDIVHGKQVFLVCKTCHTTGEGGPNMTGPNLYGVFGRKAGSTAGFNYSDGLKATGITWDAAQIEKWITNPKAVVAETKMTYVGMKDAKDRADVIAYLKSETSAAPK